MANNQKSESFPLHQPRRRPLANPTVLRIAPGELGYIRSLPSGIRQRPSLATNPCCLVFSRDGRHLVTGTGSGQIVLWDLWLGKKEKTLTGHFDGAIRSISLAPDSRTLATASVSSTEFWDLDSGKPLAFTRIPPSNICVLAFCPRLDCMLLAAGTQTGDLYLGNLVSGDWNRIGTHGCRVTSLVWSPDGKFLAAGMDDGILLVFEPSRTEAPPMRRTAHARGITALAWAPQGDRLATCGLDATIRIWGGRSEVSTTTNHQDGVSEAGKLPWRLEQILEGLGGAPIGVSFSPRGEVLATLSLDNCLRLWRCDRWESVASVPLPVRPTGSSILAFSPDPKAPILAVLSQSQAWHSHVACLEIDFAFLTRLDQSEDTVHYTNAKVVLVGETAVGKSALSLVLMDEKWVPTESTHARKVRRLSEESIEDFGGRQQIREIYLWDLAGQAGYRLVHQLHLHGVSVAVVVFDARSETDPFFGVKHWDRALRVAHRVQGHGARAPKKLLVAARTDRGSVAVSPMRIDSFRKELEFEGYYETSAKEGRGIAELKESILRSIDWESLPGVTSNTLFQTIKEFLLKVGETRRVLCTEDELYKDFLKESGALKDSAKLRGQFETGITLLESQRIARRLSFGSLVLLKPPLLDVYASALIDYAKQEPDGLGHVMERIALKGGFRIPPDERLRDAKDESRLLVAMIEDLLRFEIALREDIDDEPYLVFPAGLTREYPTLPEPEGMAVKYLFDGPVLNMYATLAVRLSHSGVFTKREMWKNAVVYEASPGGQYGMYLRDLEEGRGEMTLFFRSADPTKQRKFEDYVRTHLERRAVPGSVQRKHIPICPNPECQTSISENIVNARRNRGHDSMSCPVCSERIPIDEPERSLSPDRLLWVQEMDRQADAERNRVTAVTILSGKVETGDYDLFLAHHAEDAQTLRSFAGFLGARGLNVWLDNQRHPPQSWFAECMQRPISQVRAAALCIGSAGLGGWSLNSVKDFVEKCRRVQRPVFPILLPGETNIPPGLHFVPQCIVRLTSLDDVNALALIERLLTGRLRGRLI